MRIEMDSLGTFEVPDDAWYGAQTARAVRNFPISGRGPDPDFVDATVRIKLAAAAANRAAGWLDDARYQAIAAACRRILAGELRDQFVVDRFQAGAGTSHHMNVNEVLANLATVALGGEKGRYDPVHPNDHVNLGQSTNDVIPAAIRLTVLAKLPRLLAAIDAFVGALERVAAREAGTITTGRTHLQDAAPTTIGREFGAYAFALRRAAGRLTGHRAALSALPLGGTAVGTGLNAAPGFARDACEELSVLTGEAIAPAANTPALMHSMGDLAAFSGSIRELALELTRVANDLRLLASGPRTGLNELSLPPVQPGSSAMPGKVNPVMLEMLNQVCYQVLGQDHAVALMAQAGQLEINVMMPALGSALFDAMDWLTAAVRAAAEKGVAGITVDRAAALAHAERSTGLATLLNRLVGYAAAAEVFKEAEATGRTIKEVAVARGLCTAAAFDDALRAAALTGASPAKKD